MSEEHRRVAHAAPEARTPRMSSAREATTPQWDAFHAALPDPLAALHDAPPADVLPLPGGRDVTVDELVQVLRDQTARPRGPGRTLPLRNNYEGAAWIAAAWRHTVHRQARAVLTLLDADLDAEAQANARSAVEHAIELVRLAAAADRGALEPFMAALAAENVARQSKQLRRLAEIDETTGGTNRELIEHALAAMPQLPAAAAGPRTVKDKFEAALPGGKLFHDVYGRLSEATHAGMTSAARYLGGMLKHGGPIPARPDTTQWAETLAVLAWSCWAADDALSRFVDGDPNVHVRHAKLLARIGLAVG
jgi:hypothetical protein